MHDDDPTDVSIDELGNALRENLAHSTTLLNALDSRPRPDASAADRTLMVRLSQMEDRVAAVEEDRRETSERLVEVEQQTSRLMTLYVATYELHSTLDPARVQQTISDIALNLLGAEHFVLLLRKGASPECEVVMSRGVEGNPMYDSGTYSGGDTVVDAALDGGGLCVGAKGGKGALAAVPLTIEGMSIGALVLLKLLDHKTEIMDYDRELLDLLAAHAATALVAARVYAKTDQKMRTLEGLMDLLRKT